MSTDATFGAALPVEGITTLLLREATDLSRYRVELHALPGVLAEPADDPVLLAERFGGDPAAGYARFRGGGSDGERPLELAGGGRRPCHLADRRRRRARPAGHGGPGRRSRSDGSTVIRRTCAAIRVAPWAWSSAGWTPTTITVCRSTPA